MNTKSQIHPSKASVNRFTFAAILVLTFLTIAGCQKETITNDTLKTGASKNITLQMGACHTLPNGTVLCFDSVSNDSRCPTGLLCIWQGNAEVWLSVKSPSVETKSVSLNTFSGFCTDTIIQNYSYNLISLNPYPKYESVILPHEYIVEIRVTNIDELSPNAKVIDFNTDKCGCCWGWTIVVGNDTLKTDDEILSQVIGYEITEPINVYLELGQPKNECYYQILNVVKL